MSENFNPAEVNNRILSGETAGEVAADLGMTVVGMRRQMEAAGTQLRCLGAGIFKSYRLLVQDMKPLDAIEFLLGEIEKEQPWHEVETVSEACSHGFTPAEARILLLLAKREGRGIHREQLVECTIQPLSADRVPTPKNVDVQIVRIRKKLKALEWGVRIDTIWGIGYRFEREPGGRLPWESAA